MREKIAIGSDHAGYKQKELIKKFLLEKGIEVIDVGCFSEERVDYPDFAIAVAKEVARGEVKGGILICGTGIGMSIVANKFPGIRASLCWDEEIAVLAKSHNNANIITLSGRFLSVEKALKIVEKWLTTPFSGGRHAKRLEKIVNLEKELYNDRSKSIYSSSRPA